MRSTRKKKKKNILGAATLTRNGDTGGARKNLKK